jgi:restriction system protein
LKVGVDIVRELYGVMAARGATGGFVVTSGRFTDEATSFASGRNVNLVDGPKLHGLIRQAKAGIDRSPARSSSSSSAAAAPGDKFAVGARIGADGTRDGRRGPQPDTRRRLFYEVVSS